MFRSAGLLSRRMKMRLAGGWQSLRRKSRSWNSASVTAGVDLNPFQRRNGLRRRHRIDYVSNQGTTVISEDVEKSGHRIEVPINEKKVSRVWYLLPRQNAAPTQFQFRCHLSLDGVETQSVLPAVIQQRYMRIGLARTLFRQVILTP